MAKDDGVGLAEAIKALRTELGQAMAEGSGQDIHFRLGPIEMEFQLEIENKFGGEAGIKFWVVTVGGSGSHTRGRTHRVALSLVPVGPDGKDLEVSARLKKHPE
jgi:Trypsin-co-occurring domain 2